MLSFWVTVDLMITNPMEEYTLNHVVMLVLFFIAKVRFRLPKLSFGVVDSGKW